MCTILTFDKEFYNKNKTVIRKRILTDAFSNGDGFAMLLMGESSEDTNMIRSMNVEVLLAVLEYQMQNEACERAWIHCRFATTGFVGLNGCHGFAAQDYTVFHNGVLSRTEADGFSVDSELIAFDIESAGVEQAIRNLSEHDSYANVFIVNNQTGQYNVIRKTGGSLFTDGKGNYSTNKFSSINRTVPVNTRTEFGEHIVEYIKPSYSGYDWDNLDRIDTASEQKVYTKSGYYSGDGKFYNSTNGAKFVKGSDTGTDSKTWTGPLADVPVSDTESDEEFEDKLAEMSMLIESLTHIKTMEDLAELAEYENWTRLGIPQEIYENMNWNQLQWCVKLQLFTQRYQSAKAS